MAGPVGALATPVPLKASEAEPPAALCPMLTLAVRAPTARGVNVTLIVHEAPALRTAPEAQLPPSAKSDALLPPNMMLLMVSDPVPLLLKVAERAGETMP